MSNNKNIYVYTDCEKLYGTPISIFLISVNTIFVNWYMKLHLTLKALFKICYYQSLGTGSKRKLKIFLIEAYFKRHKAFSFRVNSGKVEYGVNSC